MAKSVRVRRAAHLVLDPASRYSAVVRLPSGARVLDVGCGNHSPSVCKALNPAIRYVGIDVGEYNLDARDREAADELVISTAEGFAGDVGRWRAAFDLVVCAHTIEHVEDRVATLGAMARSVAPGGVLHLTFPDARSLGFPSRRGTLNFRDDPTHREPVEVDAVVAAVQAAGLRLRHARVPHRPLVLRTVGLLNEPRSRARGEVLRGTWAWWGFEDLLVFAA